MILLGTQAISSVDKSEVDPSILDSYPVTGKCMQGTRIILV